MYSVFEPFKGYFGKPNIWHFLPFMWFFSFVWLIGTSTQRTVGRRRDSCKIRLASTMVEALEDSISVVRAQGAFAQPMMFSHCIRLDRKSVV